MAYSFNPDNPLFGVSKEFQKVLDVLFPISKDCIALPRPFATAEDIRTGFSNLTDELLIFHFSGHAGANILQVNDLQGTAKILFSKHLAEYIKPLATGLKLVFLNGCSTRDQADFFLDSGISAVIASNKPIKDSYALDFAVRFYTEFTSRTPTKTLQQAFDAARNSFYTDNGSPTENGANTFNSDFINESVRGIFTHMEEDSPEIYDLHIQKDSTVGSEKFEEWVTETASGFKIQKVEKDKVQSMGVSTDGYLLCDRATETGDFERICLEKLSNKRPEPAFFFYHDMSYNRPDLIPRRFELFSLRKICGNTIFDFKELDLPDIAQFSDNDPLSNEAQQNQDRFKIRLSEIYKEKVGGKDAEPNRLCALNRRPPDEQLFVIHHRLNLSEWTDFKNPIRNETLQKYLETLLDWYINTYSKELQRDLSERLIIVFSASFNRPNPFIHEVFEKMKQKMPNHAFNFNQLDNIIVDDVDEWQKSFLVEDKDQTLFNATLLFNDIQKDAYDLPLSRLITPLQMQIESYNKRYFNKINGLG